jgi:hypothetical protein
MRTHSLADSAGALRGLSGLMARAANRMPYYWGALALAECSARLRRGARRTEKLDRLFWHQARMARFAPDIHFAVNREIEEPFRVARCVVLHLEPFRPGLVVGWYGRQRLDEYDALCHAVTLRTPTRKDLDAYDDEKLHGPGKPVGLRFSATVGGPLRGWRPGPGVAAAEHDGAGQ